MSTPAEGAATAFLFPGVGAPLSGGERRFFMRHRSVMKDLVDEASTAAGADLGKALERDTIADLDESAKELFTFAFSCGVHLACREKLPAISVIAGYSLGVYPALFAAGSLSYPESLLLVGEARRLALEASPEVPCGMGVVVGLYEEELQAAGDRAGCRSVVLVSSNNSSFKVFAGYRKELERFLDEAEAAGAFRAVLMDCSIPYHHPSFLAESRGPFQSVLRRLNWSPPVTPVISSIGHHAMTGVEELIEFTARNLTEPIDWERVVIALKEREITMAVECGPGLSLTQSAALVDGAPRHVNLRNIQGAAGL
jgi:[acyl-carrier-protein] S-malonyltransferase